MFVSNFLKVRHLVWYFLFFALLFSTHSVAQDARQKYELAGQYRSRGEYSLAIAHYTEAIRLNPPFAEAYAERGYCYSRQKADKQALNDYDQAIALGYADKLVYLNRGWAKYNLGQTAAACLDWRMAEQLGYPNLQETIQKYCN
ncbi:MAG: tetratricopeptide repeat protein [Microscillaceae bacterium]|jgi:tetratricopeptide (TPR) repeat protein|nr:tetratricopeptide repeat protein [Microscillaceae bacterium]